MIDHCGEADIPNRLLGRPFGRPALEQVQALMRQAQGCPRAELARRLCRQLGWTNRRGGWALMSARVGLLRLQARGLIALPAPRNGNGNGRRYRPAADLPIAEASGGLESLQPLVWQVVAGRECSRLWNSLIERYHYLGHENLPGAQIRYLIWSPDKRLVGAIGFGAAAWQLACRDRWIGWTPEQRRGGLDLILNNARFLVVPRVANLASHILGGSLRRLAGDFEQRYGWRPVLLETFVQARYRAHCYRAANWIYLGPTQGRGKKGGHPAGEQTPVPIKAVWVYPLRPDFRRRLCGLAGPADG